MKLSAYLSLTAITMLISASSVFACDDDALGTSRVMTLKRESALYGSSQHQALPLAKNEIVLTFDDGPSPDNTTLVLKALAEQCSRASFFMVGQQIEKHPALAKQVADQGHSLALHSYSHQRLVTMSIPEQLTDLAKAKEAFTHIFGIKAPAYRFPFLQETPSLLAALKSEKMTVASIDLSIDDWLPTDDTERLLQRLNDSLDKGGGGILLMHDAHPPTAKAMPELLKLIKRKGFKLVHLVWED